MPALARTRSGQFISTRTRTVAPRVAIVRVPGAPATRRGRAGAFVRRGASVAARAVRDEKHTITAIIAAAGLGFAKKNAVSLPKIAAIGTAGTYGLGAWLGARMTRSPVLAHVATGLLSVAAFNMAAGETLSGEDDDDEDW